MRCWRIRIHVRNIHRLFVPMSFVISEIFLRWLRLGVAFQFFGLSEQLRSIPSMNASHISSRVLGLRPWRRSHPFMHASKNRLNFISVVLSICLFLPVVYACMLIYEDFRSSCIDFSLPLCYILGISFSPLLGLTAAVSQR